ncbi:MAG TPA: ABC transporter ATP-binding protein, partial [Phototrophicaceae bacterium]|nr:ABC transporter ATP-binding protein [Phototrophicaceae bacterium]
MQAQTALSAGNRPARRGGNSTIRRAIGYLRNHRRTNTLAYGALIIATLAQLAVPQLIKNMIDAVTSGSLYNIFNEMNPIQRGLALSTVGKSMDQLKLDNEAGPALLVNAVLFILVLALIRGVFSFVQAYMAESTSQGVAFDFRNEIFAKIQRLSFSYYDRTQTGQLMIRATDDVEKVRLFIAQGLIATAQALILLIASLTILFLINWRLTLVVLPILPVSVVLFMAFGAISQPLFAAVQVKLSALNTVLQENVAGIKVVKAFVRENREQKRLDNAAQALFDQFLKVSLVFSILFPLIFFVAQVGNAGLLYFGGSQIINQTLSLGDYQQFSLYLLYLFLPLGQLGFIISLLAQASASASRIFEILDTESEVKNKDDAIDLPQIQGSVEFKDVTFRYFSSGEAVLKNVSFEAKPGMTVALLGATGSGKTTIINLLPRFYDVSEGAVVIDGYDIRNVTLDSLRRQIGIVL